VIVDFIKILRFAKEHKFGIPAVTSWDERSVRMTLEAAVELDSPIIIGFVKNYGRNEVFEKGFAHRLAENVEIPVSFYCDHSSTFEDTMWGINARFNCIMVDQSGLPYEKIVSGTRDFVRIAHAVNIAVEAGIDHIPHAVYVGKTEKLEFTDVGAAKKFVNDTGIDVLSISIGNLHGIYKENPVIDYRLLKEINDNIPAFLSIHGSSGIGFSDINKLSKSGITKFCMQSYLSRAAINAAKDYMEKNKDNPSPRSMLLKTISEQADKGWKDELKRYISAMDAENKAGDFI
jgi:fructose-bisphosphate aldolase, class II